MKFKENFIVLGNLLTLDRFLVILGTQSKLSSVSLSVGCSGELKVEEPIEDTEKPWSLLM